MELPHDADGLLSGIYLPKRNKTYVHTEMQNVAVSFVIASLVAQMVKKPACKAGDPGSIPGSGRSPGEENGNPVQFSRLENPMDRGAWWAAVHGVAKSRTRLSD